MSYEVVRRAEQLAICAHETPNSQKAQQQNISCHDSGAHSHGANDMRAPLSLLLILTIFLSLSLCRARERASRVS